jgi:hypothetical protein
MIINNDIHPYAVICFLRDEKEPSMFSVVTKEGDDIPGFFGTIQHDDYVNLFLDILWEDSLREEKDELLWLPREYYCGQEKWRITNYQLFSYNRGYATYGNDAILISISADSNRVTLLFYEWLGEDASHLFELWQQGLLEAKIT